MVLLLNSTTSWDRSHALNTLFKNSKASSQFIPKVFQTGIFVSTCFFPIVLLNWIFSARDRKYKISVNLKAKNNFYPHSLKQIKVSKSNRLKFQKLLLFNHWVNDISNKCYYFNSKVSTIIFLSINAIWIKF